MARLEAAVRSQQLAEAARRVLSREGVARTSLRDVAAEGGVPLGTLQYVYPTREQLLRRVIEDLIAETAAAFETAVPSGASLEQTLRIGLSEFWSHIADNRCVQIMQYELTTYSLREPDQAALARFQYESYARAAARWCQLAAESADETCAISFEQLGRIIVASVDGLILQYICNGDDARSHADLEVMIDMLVRLADPKPRSA